RERGIDDRLAAGQRNDHDVDAAGPNEIADALERIASSAGRCDDVTRLDDRVLRRRQIGRVLVDRKAQRRQLERRTADVLAGLTCTAWVVLQARERIVERCRTER